VTLGSIEVTPSGLVLLIVSAILQAFQAILEERIFRLDPDLDPMVMCGIEALWKIAVSVCLTPLYFFVSCPLSICEGG